MNKCARLAVLLFASISAIGQVSSSTPVAVPTDATPVKVIARPMEPELKLPLPKPQPTVPDATRYLNDPSRLAFCTNQVALFNDRDADIIFIGDSITAGWLSKGKEVWQANFASRALNFGVGGDQTQHVLWRMENYPIARLHPKVAVILIGTNNKSNTPEEIAAGVKAVIAKTQAMYPGINIVLNSIMPNGRANELMMAANKIVRTYADDKKVFYLDLVPLMTPVGDNWKGLGPDHLHPDEAGYNMWAEALLPIIDRLLPGTGAASPPTTSK